MEGRTLVGQKRKSIIMGEFAQNITNHVHEKIHDGNHYRICESFDGLGSGAVQNFGIVTSSNIIHLIFAVTIKSEGAISVFESVDVTSAGTSIPIINSNRISTNTPNETINKNTDVNSKGTVLCNSLYLPAGNKIGSEMTFDDEFELKTGTNYLIEIGSLAASNRGSLNIVYYVE